MLGLSTSVIKKKNKQCSTNSTGDDVASDWDSVRGEEIRRKVDIMVNLLMTKIKHTSMSFNLKAVCNIKRNHFLIKEIWN